jgi:uncharacterized protein YeaO (DUF488 family)
VALRLTTYSYGSPRRRGEGLRLGCTRYSVRGVPRGEYAARNIWDVWLPTLAPSRELLAWARRKGVERGENWREFERRYRREMETTDARQVIRTLAQIAKRTPISIGCYCRGPHCHRFILERIIRSAAENGF